MNPKQIACFILLAFVGVLTYTAQMIHKTVATTRAEAEDAETAAVTAENERSTAEIETAVFKEQTEEVRRFLRAWLPSIEHMQTQQEAEQTIELSLRERGINLVRSRKTEPKSSSGNKIIPKSIITTMTIEEEYAKVLNWLGDIERRLPTARMRVVQITGGSTSSQLKMDVSFETPIFDLAAADADKKKAAAAAAAAKPAKKS
ncbi:hypothetical protein [Prosthecobacter vanneervenii]|uniref:Uncharacterized protein n=1 Tax=Prosthecobacter vanneervenii TaxID=48466 RepID=A0A7W7Y7R6_9BACT|nr:hypothetical protein [Prosthecobacter vanneervenii]MBB5031151.1 hypothetical protein [Prosthecobacter vanneervenii]